MCVCGEGCDFLGRTEKESDFLETMLLFLVCACLCIIIIIIMNFNRRNSHGNHGSKRRELAQHAHCIARYGLFCIG